ncbi:GAF domain-containing SpoIIE family protein phosphatase [Actinomadura parmotrematis]|uniref:SpoIIE family protein phosphatase n=1 Tax=Actinomadura parmotrematis TaxID=2864039 RepID=A0ABS7FQ50_9ACTN|nr:SpoIIE family protein phosphatase [Actinomadura parmotrematis]MBW8482441.1 SpoIIE family protein phosphatase [Actinomadura parmotrematis]
MGQDDDGARAREAERLRALEEVGLTARQDSGMERFARLVARTLDVPVALVSLVEADRQVFPGQVGLGEPWASSRWTPLSHSLCRHVVAGGRPLVLADARADELTCDNLAIPDLGVVAYAGMPLTDNRGNTLGSLVAVDTRPRTWTAGQLADLEDLAAACSVELRLRRISRQAMRSRRAAEAARAEAESANARAQAAGERLRGALDRTGMLLRAAEFLVDTTGVEEVRRRVRELMGGDLKPAYVGLMLAEDGRLRRVPDPDVPVAVETAHELYDPDGWPSGRAYTERRTVTVADRRQAAAEYSADTVRVLEETGLHAAIYLPLFGAGGVLGVLALAWDREHAVGGQERAVLTAIAGYTAQALERGMLLDERTSVARQLQEAMLTDLPTVPGLELAARYCPAGDRDQVGGDWYDAYPLRPAGEAAGRPAPIAVTVGDITGHDTRAAAVMGQARAMLRQADLDHRGHGPAHIVTAFERACETLPLEATGSLIHAHLAPLGDGSWEMTWTNAGHPPMLLTVPASGAAGPAGAGEHEASRHPCGCDGDCTCVQSGTCSESEADGTAGRDTAPAEVRAERLTGHDRLLWPGLPFGDRTDRTRVLPPGSTVLLYTDGLVERPGRSIDAAIDRTAGLLAGGAARPLPDLLEHLTLHAADGDPGDDVVVLAVRVPARPSREVPPT